MKYCLVFCFFSLVCSASEGIKSSIKNLSTEEFELVSGNCALDRETINLQREAQLILKNMQVKPLRPREIKELEKQERKIIYWYIKQAEQSKNI